ncbi:DoxX family protein [Pseudoalteromonas denitrificans]|jgi:putative oxidoreductase|uniref:Putative oxidoreductase n=1 Tax=Pseudoalteromonas denitrificans DSM 6059 TaxID=1123010 RepID=A0A1I1PYA6_9GAMM|nr:DoxX family protein [Pseudoalteromonas denitrificans]SFD14809.1 putative oxidoreductase [Pseudoalteromonas denitrificans DSM 6059]
MTHSTIKQSIHNITTSNTGLDTLALRLGAGSIFFAHGAQKLFAWFGGYGLEGTGGWMESIGITPGILMAGMAGSAEFIGGLLLIFGLLVRPASFVLAITMLVAIFTVHIDNGLFMSKNGYEFALALLIISISLAFRGAGSLSVDKLLTKKLGV